MDSSKVTMVPVSCRQLSKEITSNDSGKDLLLIDIRPNAQHCSKRISRSENIYFSSIFLRRLMKGVVLLGSLIPSDLAQRITSRDSEDEKLIIYDASSTANSIRTELVKHAEVLTRNGHSKNSEHRVYFLDGGFNTFSVDYPHLCASSRKARSSLGISVSPILALPGPSKRQFSKLQTPSDDSIGQFGPPVQVLPYLILGCAKDSSNLTLLRKLGVTAVLNVSHNCPNHFESLLEYKSINVQDSYQADLLSKMETAIEYINSIKSKNGRVFLHCHAGISRSATICIAYIMKTKQWDLSKAYEFVKQKRPCISPNLHFMGQLLEFQKQLQDSSDEMDYQSCPEDSLCSIPLPTSVCMATGSLHFGMSSSNFTCPSLFKEENVFHGSNTTPIPSASAPSSLNLDRSTESDFLNVELCSTVPQAFTTTKECSLLKTIVKPTSLPLVHSHRIHLSSTDSVLYGHLKDRQPLSSISLPTTPISQHKNHLPFKSSISQRLSPLPLKHSPCRVVAKLGSESDACLNYQHAPLTESM